MTSTLARGLWTISDRWPSVVHVVHNSLASERYRRCALIPVVEWALVGGAALLLVIAKELGCAAGGTAQRVNGLWYE
ncbi:MAG: hypothetical protein ACP5O0_07930 [Acidimicrobiales bacterium]